MLAQMLKVQSRLTRLRASMVAIRPPDGTKMSFDLNVDIKQVSRTGPTLRLRYSIGIETFPLIYRAEIAGFADLNAEMLAKDESLQDLGEGVLSDVALQIFRQDYESLYLTLSTMGADSPSPWLVREVHLVQGPGAK